MFRARLERSFLCGAVSSVCVCGGGIYTPPAAHYTQHLGECVFRVSADTHSIPNTHSPDTLGHTLGDLPLTGGDQHLNGLEDLVPDQLVNCPGGSVP